MYEDDKLFNANFMMLKIKIIKILFFQIVGNIKKWLLVADEWGSCVQQEQGGASLPPSLECTI